MDSINTHPKRKAVCPLFNFRISEVLIGRISHGNTMYYFKKLGEKFEKGIEILDNVRIRRINSQDLEKFEELPSC